MHGFLDFFDTGHVQEHFCLGDSLYAHLGNAGPPDPNGCWEGFCLLF